MSADGLAAALQHWRNFVDDQRPVEPPPADAEFPAKLTVHVPLSRLDWVNLRTGLTIADLDRLLTRALPDGFRLTRDGRREVLWSHDAVLGGIGYLAVSADAEPIEQPDDAPEEQHDPTHRLGFHPSGYAMCSCGERSKADAHQNRTKQQSWHQKHKRDVRALANGADDQHEGAAGL